MSETVIALNGLSRRFPGMDRPAVAPLTCTIRAGYVTGLVGPDGAGKTTLMRMLAGLLKPDEGRASVIGFDPLKDDSALHAVLGYMPQKFGLYEDLTVMENLTLYADLRSVTGAGKSTTFKMMCGLLVPTSGKALVLGMDLKVSSGKARQHLGYMAQKFSLYGNLSVEQNLRFFSGVYGLRGRAQNEKIARMSDAFGLKSIARHAADELPLGYKQRLALACSLMHEPDILFLDEPTSGVDPLTRREFWLHINSMVDKGVTVMVTTHFMDEAEYCDRIGLVYHGKLIASGTPDALKAQAADDSQTDPTMEQAFITLINRWDKENSHGQ
ncbi:TPA: ABC transporter ATP-binding protein [Klebsiella pneumoniae]|nr:ABC transporter ATP-binding protein [Klebsiella pneumoniae]